MSKIVKKGLLECANETAPDCRPCPYRDLHAAKCIRALASDALAYIETLEERLAAATIPQSACLADSSLYTREPAPSVSCADSSPSQGSLETEEQR